MHKINNYVSALTIFLLLLISQNSQAQDNSWDIFSLSGNFGLMAEDGDYLWVVRDNKFIKINRFTLEGTYYSFETSNFPLNISRVWNLVVDKRNKVMWCLVETNNGLYLCSNSAKGWDTYPYTFYTKAITVDTEGYVITYEHGDDEGIYKLNEGEVAEYIPTSISGSVDHIAVDSLNNYWFGCHDSGLHKYEDGTMTSFPLSSTGVDILDLKVDYDNVVWFLSYSGMHIFSDYDILGTYTGSILDTVIDYSHSAATSLSRMAAAPDGSKWFCGGWRRNAPTPTYGAHKYDGTYFEPFFTYNSGLPADWVHSIVADADGNTWFTTKDKGLTRLTANAKWEYINTDEKGIPRYDLNAAYTAKDEGVWFITGKEALLYKDSVWTLYNNLNSDLIFKINDIAEDKEGNIWFATDNGIAKFDGVVWKTYEKSQLYNRFTKIMVDAYGEIFAMGKYIKKFNGTAFETFKYYPMPDPVFPTYKFYLYNMTSDSLGNNYFEYHAADNDYLLLQFNGTNGRDITPNQGGPFIDIYGYADGFWGIRDSIIHKYDGQSWTVYENRPLPNSEINNIKIKVDNYGLLWAASGSSVYSFDGIQWEKFNTDVIPGKTQDFAFTSNNGIWFASTRGAAFYKNPSSSVVEEKQESEIHTDFRLSPNYPNPFNPSTLINFSLPERANVKLAVYDILGREVEIISAGELNAGSYNYSFNASGLASGVYIYTLSAKGSSGKVFYQSRKMLLMK